MESLYYDRKTKVCVNFPWSEACGGLSHTAGEAYTHSTESEACVSVLNITVHTKHSRRHDAELSNTHWNEIYMHTWTYFTFTHTRSSVISRVPLTGLSNTRWRWERIYITGGTCHTHTHKHSLSHTHSPRPESRGIVQSSDTPPGF